MSTTRTLQALITTARTSVGAVTALLMAPNADGQLEVVASAGGGAVGAIIDPAGSYGGMVLVSEQPMALRVRPGDARVASEAALLGRTPSAICCVPCVGSDDVTGVIELVDKSGGDGFAFDDVEIVTLLAEVAGSALEERVAGHLDVPSPEQLFTTLSDLCRRDGARYERIALLVEMVLAAG